MKNPRSTAVKSATVFAGCVLLVSGCVTPNQSDLNQSDLVGVPAQAPELSGDALWESLRYYGASEVVPDAPPSILAEKSVAVVRGNFTGSCGMRTIQGDVAIDRISMPCLELSVTDVMSGSLEEKVVQLEFPFGPDEIEDLHVPRAEVVAFLVNKGGVEAEYYALVNSSGLWSSTGRGEIDQPVAVEQPTPKSEYVGKMMTGATSWGQFVELLDRAVG